MGRARLAHLHGVHTSYEPAPGRTVHVGDETVVAVLAALGVDASTPRAVRAALDRYEHGDARALLPPTVVLRPGRPPDLSALPEGTELRVETEAGDCLDWGCWDWGTNGPAGPARTGPPALDGPAGRLPYGVHLLRAYAPDGRAAHAHLVVAPDRTPAPPARTHGFMVQLYSLLSARSWGMGDLGDLGELAAWAGRAAGAGFVQINPLHSAVPGPPTDPSPYRPSSRRFPDPIHLRIEDVPEFARLAGSARTAVDALLARAGELREAVLGKGALIDRDAVWELKKQALELVCDVPLGPGRRAAYEEFLARQGRALDDHATWCALAEVHGADWRRWPAGLRDPRSDRTERARASLGERVDLHRRLAWLTDQQLARAQRAAREAGMGIGLIHDLAVGAHPHGADTWAWQDVHAPGMSIGAPPDAFNSRGQDWGLPPWRPDALARCGYAPFQGLVRGLLRHAGALRVDHVMGLFRLWWVPEGLPPTQGCYVRYDAEAMLSVLALEAHRAGAAIIGEDLGTVEPGVREELAGRGVLGTSVLWFEREWEREGAPPLPPESWRAGCLATATTHDLPTTAARLTGDHAELRARLGLLDRPPAEERAEELEQARRWLRELRRLGMLDGGTPGEGGGPADGAVDGPVVDGEEVNGEAFDGEAVDGEEVDEEEAVRAVHRFLLRTPARMVGVWLPDAVGDRRPQNLPGTRDEHPNWRLPIADPAGRPLSLERIVDSPRLHALMREFDAPPRQTGP